MSSRSAKETKINSLMRRCSLHAWCTVTTQGQLKHFHKFLTRISQKRMPNLTNQTRATLQTGMTIVQKLTHKLKKMPFRAWSPDLRLNLFYQLQVVWISRLGSPILYATSIRMCKFLLWLNQPSASWLNADAIVVQNLIWILETKRFFKCHWLWVFFRILMKGITWSRDSHGLFDYESRHLTKKTLKADKANMIMRTGNDLSLVNYNNLESF